MEICAKNDEGNGDRAVTCMRYGTLNGMQVHLKYML